VAQDIMTFQPGEIKVQQNEIGPKSLEMGIGLMAEKREPPGHREPHSYGCKD